MAATRLLGKLNDACAATLDTITGLTVHQGRVRMADGTDFESTIRSLTVESQAIAVTWVSNVDKRPLDNGICELSVLLFFRLLKDTSSDCNKMYDLLDEVVSTLAKDTVWNALGAKALGVASNREEDGLQDDVVEWKVVVTLSIPPTC